MHEYPPPMTCQLDFPITAEGPVTRAVARLGLYRFDELAEHIRRLPYGRADTGNVLSVLHEGRGTCSGKHRLLAAAAHECGRPELQLVVGIYAMSEHNTPGTGPVLAAAGFSSIPEAHCYLRLGGKRHDFTGLGSGAASPFDALCSEHVVPPAGLPGEKRRLHHQAIRSWAADHGVSVSDAWALRERCIEVLVSVDAAE